MEHKKKKRDAHISFRADAKTKKKLFEIAAENLTSVGTLIRQAIKKEVKEYEVKPR